MIINSFLFIIFFYLIFLSVLGYGYFFFKFFKINISQLSFGLVGLSGIFFLTFISYFTNLIVPHDLNHNLLILLLGLFFVFFLFYKEEFLKKKIIKIFLISLFYIISLFISKNHEDFGYYHLASVINLTENKIQFGLANFNSGFGTHSSIFYFNSLLYFPIIKYYLFNVHSLLILIFSSIFFLDHFFFKRVNKNNFISILSFFLFVFINLIFSRLAAYGTDRAGQIVVFVIFIIFFDILKKNGFFIDNIKILLALIAYVITIKSYFLVYIFLFPLIFLKLKKTDNFKFFIKNFYFILFLSLYVLLYFFVNIANTGCIIFPLSITCFSDLFWSVSLESVINLNNWFELWSKAGATPNYVVDNKIEYLNNFNWVANWTRTYFFGKGIDLIGSIVLIILTFLLIFSFNQNRIKSIIFKTEFLYLYCALILFLLIWFNKHPDLRYGGYSIIALIFFIPASIYLSRFDVFHKKNNLLICCIVLAVITSFNIRNYIRISSELKREDPYKFDNFPFFSKKYFETKMNFGFSHKRIVIKGYNFYISD
jgi:hypothetical protein